MRRDRLAAVAFAASVAILTASLVQAAGRRPYGGTARVALATTAGWDDPHRARTADARWLAGWIHCGLLRVSPDGRLEGDVAMDVGVWSRGALTLTLVEGATFHDGKELTARDVADSLQRLAAMEASGGPGLMAGALQVGVVDPRTVTIRAPAGASASSVRRLLARPEVAVLREGRPGPRRGCGAFEPKTSGGRLELSAFPGHARGRPWVDRIVVRTLPTARERSAAMAFGEVELTTEPGRRYRDTRRVDDAGDVTVFAVVHPRWRGAAGDAVRQTLRSAAGHARLSRHVDWPAKRADRPWPAGSPLDRLGPSSDVGPPGPALKVPRLVIGYPAEAPQLAELARALRDVLRGVVATVARAIEVGSVDVTEAEPVWDVGLVTLEWGATDPGQAAAELAAALGLGGLTGAEGLAGRVDGWALGVAESARAVALVHMKRPLFLRDGWVLGRGAAGLVDMSWTWRR